MRGTSSPCDKLTGGIANGLGATLIGDHRLASFLSKKSAPRIFGKAIHIGDNRQPQGKLRCNDMAFAGVYVGSLVAVTKMAEVLPQISTVANFAAPAQVGFWHYPVISLCSRKC
jgi:hypothetical protein